MHWLEVGFGGFLGAVARYALSGWFIRKFPAGTLAANLIGCLLIGFLMGLSARTGWPGPRARAFLVAGILGGLTTFSTFAWQSWELAILDKSFGAACLNLLASVAGGLLAVWIGVVISEALAGSSVDAAE